MPPGPGPVAAVHRLLIVTALIGTLVYAAWAAREVGRTHDALAGVGAGLAVVVAAGLALYLRRLRVRLSAKLTPRD
ncbi:MAG TPA: hypothetical protein VKA21_06960 [Candidatus Binatia bacterium]|nr:hypothetical protein [Candidatus Binatia bacterium]